MKLYRNYMDRQEPSAGLHETLLELSEEKKAAPRWKWSAAAAVCCAALLLGVGLFLRLGNKTPPMDQNPGTSLSGTAQSAAAGAHTDPEPDKPGNALYPEDTELPAPAVNIDYGHDSANMAADIALPTGSFFVDFSDPQEAAMAQKLLETFAAAFPDYEPHALATYDGNGDLWTLYISGASAGGQESYSLELSPGCLPPSCIAHPHDEPTVVDGVEVYGWSGKYDSNGDRVDEYYCGSEFLTAKYGFRFENIGAPYRSNYNGEKDEEMGGAMELNARFVELALSGGLDEGLSKLLYNGNIPEWREEKFTSLEEARQEKDFLPYLPENDPIAGYDEFSGYFQYQEGRSHYLYLHWSKGYDDVDIEINQRNTDGRTPVDVTVPESYDVRLYGGPWADNVPAEYQLGFYDPIFRAEDMSPEIVNARGWEKDTGGMTYHFQVLFKDGTRVYYSCSGLTAQEVWELVETARSRS